ncbi:hypothetical protein K443DRAFT_135315 [Laccaria amethystina LaAM-08-1]|uniref:Uncharacterized protein n=1 Tax=Laccaria amethystina LaAM-08-1 TaxID=1095629 RepID=A0A0C9X7H1_9AGAR|nr:hypothetical protein K443DRAFT_135315 [Laccaria amethystina LaAM-08-1]
MSFNDIENRSPSSNLGRRDRQDALHLGPRKKACTTDPLVHYGRHFGRTVHALCNVPALITNSILREVERGDDPDDSFTAHERKEDEVFQALLKMVPGLQDRLATASLEETRHIADLLQKGASSARSDDTKSLKAAIIDWITPRGEALHPPIPRNSKTERGFNHEKMGVLLCPAGLDWSDIEVKQKLRNGELLVPGDQWPIFLYQGSVYDEDDPWKGLLRSTLLVSTFKHIFTSPSSVEKEAKATRSGNARIHGMTQVTRASITYAATQARFALASAAVFSRSDTVTDSERFYNSVLELLDDVDQIEEVNKVSWYLERKEQCR